MRTHVGFMLWKLILFTIVLVQSLPYNPTTILQSKDADLIYVFQPAMDSRSHQLSSLNISSTLVSSNITLEILTPDLPFSDNDTLAFIPAISDFGEISVYAGSCAVPTDSALWRFIPSIKGNGTWIQEILSLANTSLPGAEFLSRGLSFSAIMEGNSSQTTFYAFGGMCPKQGAEAASWQSAASYSNQMLRLAPSSNMNYTLDVTPSRGSPIPEAGFSLTALTPTYSNGSSIRTKQQSFVVTGGHTSQAFINMSQVAIWNLPEESWNFVTVKNPDTDLAVGDIATSIDSRSGHTAVLTEDGSQIIVYGGWVGDVNQAAEPQLAILNLGKGYGGVAEWKWSIPATQPAGSSTYGHGAVMLPGNVMMVLGVNDSSTTKRATPGTQAMFFNASSQTWSMDYTNPIYLAKASSRRHSSTSLGVRIIVGMSLAVAAGVIIAYIGYRRHLKHEYRRDRNLGNLNAVPQNSQSLQDSEMIARGVAFPWSNNIWNHGKAIDTGNGADSQQQSIGFKNPETRSHDLGEICRIPSPPKQSPRRKLYSGSRGSYQSANLDGGTPVRASSIRSAGPIHPIYEADENDETGDIGVVIPQRVPDIKRYSDPFKDPPLSANSLASSVLKITRSSSTPDSEHVSQEYEIKNCDSDWAAADLIMNTKVNSYSSAGHVSPSQRARLVNATTPGSVVAEEDHDCKLNTHSEHTEGSVAIQTTDITHPGSGIHRSLSDSLRGFISGIKPFGSNLHSTTAVIDTPVIAIFDGPGPSPGEKAHRRLPGSADSHSRMSFDTAHTSILNFPMEAESFLPQPAEGDCIMTESSTNSPLQTHQPGSPSKNKRYSFGRGNLGWLGSIKKAFAGPNHHNFSSDDQSFVSAQESPSCDSRNWELETEKAARHGARRSDSVGILWRRKQGKSDWEDKSVEASRRSPTISSEPSPVFTRPSAGDDEWDIERAVENRVVQVMFTVPKKRLRVVNQDISADVSEAGGSLKSQKGGSSGESLKNAPPMEEAIRMRLVTVDSDLGDVNGSDADNKRGRGRVNENCKGKGKEKVLHQEEKDIGLFQPPSEETQNDDPVPILNPSNNRGRSPASIISKSSRKSRVMEIVEQMEKQC